MLDVNVAATPEAPASISATAVMDPNNEDQVDVHWVNTPDDETSYELQRSVDGGAFEDIDSLAADQTSYVDSSIPYNDAGDADLKYQVMSQDQKSLNQTTRSSASSPPTISTAASAAKVAVTQVNFHIGEREPGVTAIPATVSISSFLFQNYISVVGTNLQDVRVSQLMANTSSITDYQGNNSLFDAGNTMANNTGFTPDLTSLDGITTVPTTMLPIELLNADNTKGYATACDTHKGGNGNVDHANGSPYTELQTSKHDFKNLFYNNIKGAPAGTIQTFAWGYQWNNYSYYSQGGPGFPANLVSCANQALDGAQQGMLTGYGDGVDFSGVTFQRLQ